MFGYKDTFESHKSISFDLSKAISKAQESIPYSHVRTLLEQHIKLLYGENTLSDWSSQISKFCFLE